MAILSAEDIAFTFDMASDHSASDPSSSDEGTSATTPFVVTVPDANPSENNGKELTCLPGCCTNTRLRYRSHWLCMPRSR